MIDPAIYGLEPVTVGSDVALCGVYQAGPLAFTVWALAVEVVPHPRFGEPVQTGIAPYSYLYAQLAALMDVQHDFPTCCFEGYTHDYVVWMEPHR